MQLSDFSPGMQAWYGRRIVTVIKPAVKRVHITVNGKTRAVLPSELEPVSTPDRNTYIRELELPPVVKLRTTRQYSYVKPEVTLNAAQRRARRNGATRYSLSLA